MTEIPSWTDYTVTVGAEYAKYLEESGVALGGLRIMDLGDGRAALDAEAVKALARQPEDADGCVEIDAEGGEHLVWIQGGSFPLARSFGTGHDAEHQRQGAEALAWFEDGVTYGA